jgi:hypothetical protein
MGLRRNLNSTWLGERIQKKLGMLFVKCQLSIYVRITKFHTFHIHNDYYYYCLILANDSDDSDDSADENYCETTTNKKAESFVTTIVRDRQLKSHLIPASTAAKKDYRSINDTISIAICNLLKSKKHENCWQVFNIFYRRVMIYGKLQVLHQYEKSEKTYYKLEIDDGTEKILGFFKVNNDEGKKGKKKIKFDRINHNYIHICS